MRKMPEGKSPKVRSVRLPEDLDHWVEALVERRKAQDYTAVIVESVRHRFDEEGIHPKEMRRLKALAEFHQTSLSTVVRRLLDQYERAAFPTS